MTEWKYNYWRQSYWKKEEAKLELVSNTDVYEDCDKNSKVIMKIEKGYQVIYKEIVLLNNHLWVVCKSIKESFYIPVRTWNNVPPTKKGYELGPLKHKIIKLPKHKGEHDMKEETKDGVDIYIDRELKIIFISMNEKLTSESMEGLANSFPDLEDYKTIIFESINEIKFLN